MDDPKSTQREVQTKIIVGFGLALLTLLVVGVISYRTIQGQVETARWVTHAHHVLEHLSDLRSGVDEIETGVLGYVLTRDESYLEPYRHGISAIYATFPELATLIVDAGQRSALDALKPLTDEHIALAQQAVARRRDGLIEAATQLIQAGRGKQISVEIHRRLLEMEGKEHALLEERQQKAGEHAQRTYYTLVIGSLLCAVLVAVAALIIFRDMRQKLQTERALQSSNQGLQRSVAELERRTQEVSSLSEMGDLLHSCQSLEEAHQAVARCVPRVLPGAAGALGILSASRNLVELTATWNEPRLGERVFPPDDCWALRRGRMNLVQDPQSALYCGHLQKGSPQAYCCLPLMAQGEAIGLLHLQKCGPAGAGEHDAWMSEGRQRLAGTVADHIALALANLRLREALRQQSVRDPLTGLFNRRYMEETLELELRRAVRSSRPLGILMIDVDHFKRFNDSFGHDAGDTILREISTMLKAGIRSCDVACRFGGEEFAVILPEASLEVSRQRAEQLREKAAHLNARHRFESLGNVTISIGVASFPEHGNTSELLLEAADGALYRAKREGRNRVNVASPETTTRVTDEG